jgi:hypothetical protein
MAVTFQSFSATRDKGQWNSIGMPDGLFSGLWQLTYLNHYNGANRRGNVVWQPQRRISPESKQS